MAVQVTKRPNDRCWSGNPIPYTLYSAEAAADSSIYFEVMVMFKRFDEAGYSEIDTFRQDPFNGEAKIELKDIIHGLLEYQVPSMNTVGPDSPFMSNKATGLLYIKFRQSTDAEDTWIETESDDEIFVIKGGIAWHKWRGNNFWVNYYDTIKPFLTWQTNRKGKRERLASVAERMFLAWLNLTDVFPGNIKMRSKLVFTDNSESTQLWDFPVQKHEIGYFPSGAKQLKLDEVNPSKKIYYWEFEIFDVTAAPASISEAYKYYSDNRNDYNDVTLNYRNSISGVDSVRIRGVIEYNEDRKFEQQGQVVLYNYFENQYIKGRTKAVNSTGQLIYSGNAGHLTKEEQQCLRDIHYQREVWWEQQLKWIPIIALTGSKKIMTSQDQLFPFEIEFAISNDGDSYFTPDSINLAEGNVPTVPSCDVVISVPTVDGTGPWTVQWDLVGGTPIKYLISTPGVSGGAPHESTDTEYTFSWLPAGDNVITVTPVCKIGTESYFGASKTVTITVGVVCVPVSLPTDADLPDATAGAAYSYNIDLGGTAPFTLGTVVKPSWMTVAIVGSQLQLSGNPTAGDAVTNFPFKAVINNCIANSVTFIDTMNVTNPPGATFTGRWAALEMDICSAPSAIYYLGPGYTSLVGGATVFNDYAMTSPVSTGFILNEINGIIYSITDGVVIHVTGNAC